MSRSFMQFNNKETKWAMLCQISTSKIPDQHGCPNVVFYYVNPYLEGTQCSIEDTFPRAQLIS